ncbi:MAG: hypothetical protein ACRYG7_47940 [Janthinobacterium lividum]
MRKNIINFLFLFGLIALASVAMLLYNTNVELRSQIARRESLIKRSQANDSLSCEHTEKYAATVTKYIKNNCSLLVDGKEISLERFIDIYVGKERNITALQNDLDKIAATLPALQKAIREREKAYAVTQDSLLLYKSRLRVLEKGYGMKARTHQEGQYRITEYETSKMDSALVLLDVFRNRLSYDSVGKKWHVRMR